MSGQVELARIRDAANRAHEHLKRFEWSKPRQYMWHELNTILTAVAELQDVPDPKRVDLIEATEADTPTVGKLGRMADMKRGAAVTIKLDPRAEITRTVPVSDQIDDDSPWQVMKDTQPRINDNAGRS